MTILRIDYHLVIPEILIGDGGIVKKSEHHRSGSDFIDIGNTYGTENIMNLITKRILKIESVNKISAYTGKELDFSKATLTNLYCVSMGKEQERFTAPETGHYRVGDGKITKIEDKERER